MVKGKTAIIALQTNKIQPACVFFFIDREYISAYNEGNIFGED